MRSRIKIAHEAPLSIFNQVQKLTDYDYCLVHLLEENKEYLDKFLESKKKGREIILDNSIFELGEAFDSERFNHWIDILQPTWYIVPDVLEDSLRTIKQMITWNEKYTKVSKQIGVVQGKTYDEIVECYQYMDKIANVNMIAISFDYSYYQKTNPHPNKLISWSLGRVKLLGDLLQDGIINVSKPHHLLGCSLPIEFCFYKDYSWIYSLDTSNPIVHSIKNIQYSHTGLWSKESQKLFEMINSKDIDLDLVRYNVSKFNTLVNE